MADQALHALFIHGVGEQRADFAHESRRHLRAALKARGVSLYARSVHWSPILDGVEREMLADVGKLGSSNRPAQRLVVKTLADALCYGHHKETIHLVVDYEVSRLRADNIVVFAHSLGALVMADYLRTRAKVSVGKFVSMGCNLQLFNLGNERAFDCPRQLARKNVWLNLWDEDDALGWPMAHWLPQVEDREVSVGGWLTGWWGASHTQYFGDRRLWNKTIPNLLVSK